MGLCKQPDFSRFCDFLGKTGEEFRFELSNCQLETGNLSCDAEQLSPLPATYDSIGCVLEQDGSGNGRCGLHRIDGEGSDRATCNVSSFNEAVCLVETHE